MVTLGGTPLEELVDQGLGMMEEETGPMGRASHRGSFHSDSLLAPDTDFMTGEWPWLRRRGGKRQETVSGHQTDQDGGEVQVVLGCVHRPLCYYYYYYYYYYY